MACNYSIWFFLSSLPEQLCTEKTVTCLSEYIVATIIVTSSKVQNISLTLILVFISSGAVPGKCQNVISCFGRPGCGKMLTNLINKMDDPIFECTHLNFTVSGRSKQTSIDCAQCSHASVTSLQDYCRNDYLYLELLMYVCSTIICSGLDRNMCQLCNKIIVV